MMYNIVYYRNRFTNIIFIRLKEIIYYPIQYIPIRTYMFCILECSNCLLQMQSECRSNCYIQERFLIGDCSN